MAPHPPVIYFGEPTERFTERQPRGESRGTAPYLGSLVTETAIACCIASQSRMDPHRWRAWCKTTTVYSMGQPPMAETRAKARCLAWPRRLLVPSPRQMRQAWLRIAEQILLMSWSTIVIQTETRTRLTLQPKALTAQWR